MRRLFRHIGLVAVSILALAGAACAQMAPANCAVGTNIYYISTSGSDSYSQAQAKNKATPWKHDPVLMSDFAGSYSHTAGDCFFWRFGDTWTYADFGVTGMVGGSGSAQDYHGGGDPSFNNGGSQNRPTVDFQSQLTGNGNHPFPMTSSYITIDNIEWKDYECNSSAASCSFADLQTNHNLIWTENYWHDFQWSSPNSKITLLSATPAPSNTGGEVAYNVLDGTDGHTGGGGALVDFCESCAPTIEYNFVNFVCTNINVGADYGNSGGVANLVVAHNTFENVFSAAVQSVFNCQNSFGVHANTVQIGGSMEFHDNVVDNDGANVISCSGEGFVPGSICHFYNNVMVGFVQIPFSGADYTYVWNNTVDCTGAQSGTCVFIGNSSPAPTLLNVQNNHWITGASANGTVCVNSGSYSNSGCAAVGTLVSGNNLTETESQANAQGYSSSETNMYAPTSAAAPTVGAGNAALSSNCSASLTLCTATTYGVLEGSGEGGFVANSALAGASRSGSWDIGAYEFGSSSSDPLNAPTGLTASLQAGGQ